MSADDPPSTMNEQDLPRPGQSVRTAYGESLGAVVGTTDDGLIVEEAGAASARRVIPHDVVSAIDEHGVLVWPSKAQLEASVTTGRPASGAATVDGATEVLELKQEEIVPTTTWQQAGTVHLRTTTETVPAELDVPTTHEKLLVERVAVNQVVDQRRESWQDGDTLVVPVYEERLVITKQLVQTEELRVRRVSETRQQHISDAPQREQLIVDDPDGTGAVELRDAEPGGLTGAIKKLLP